jgi:hypothetical protein
MSASGNNVEVMEAALLSTATLFGILRQLDPLSRQSQP